jgi:hypothetical protein
MKGQKAIDFGNALLKGADKLELRSTRGEVMICEYLGRAAGYPVQEFKVALPDGIVMSVSVAEIERAHIWYKDGREEIFVE